MVAFRITASGVGEMPRIEPLSKQRKRREPTYRSRLRSEAGDEAAEMADAFLDANPDCAF